MVGIARALADGFDRVLLVPGDCPALDPGDLAALLRDRAGPPSVMIVPDRHDTGTNALLLSPPNALVPSFGPGSLRRHRERADAAGVQAEVRRPGSLLLDIDTPADLAALRLELDQRPGLALRTRAVLSSEP
jgi:2-phospho-L-lactate guanylyltransferase